MMAPSRLIASKVKDRADFVAIVSRYTWLRRAGRQYFGRCPFHTERHPSFYIEPERKLWKCFGCGAGGDLFDFVMRAEDCNFSDSLWIVADFNSGVARDSAPRSGARFGVSEGASPLAAKRPGIHSQSSKQSRAQILAQLEATNRRLTS